MIWDEIYFFGRADESTTGRFFQFEILGNDSVKFQVTGKHFLPGCPGNSGCIWAERVQMYAQDFQQGHYIWIAPLGSSKLELRQIVGMSIVEEKGLYNPYTLTGTIVVNGVIASAHSDWILDYVVPSAWTRWLPSIYQALFFPGRVLYGLLCVVGPATLDTVVNLLDVNNPQVAPDKNGRGPEFLLGFALSVACLTIFTTQLFVPALRRRVKVACT